jgi:hypothetical protein
VSIQRIPLRVGEILSATVKRKLAENRVVINLKGHTLVADPEQSINPGDEILVQVLTIFPRIRLRFLPSMPTLQSNSRQTPLDLHT